MPWLVLLPLQAGCPAIAGPQAGFWLFRCRISGASPQLFRIDPRRRRVQELDPVTREVRRTIETTEPPPGLGGGIIDDSAVTITPRQVSWEETMHRPQFARESRSIDLQTLVFHSSSSLQIDSGPEVAEQKTLGSCERLKAAGAAGAL
ncbi:MAG: hypothetical protein ACKO0M_18210 [Cyanobium sp.]